MTAPMCKRKSSHVRGCYVSFNLIRTCHFYEKENFLDRGQTVSVSTEYQVRKGGKHLIGTTTIPDKLGLAFSKQRIKVSLTPKYTLQDFDY